MREDVCSQSFRSRTNLQNILHAVALKQLQSFAEAQALRVRRIERRCPALNNKQNNYNQIIIIRIWEIFSDTILGFKSISSHHNFLLFPLSRSYSLSFRFVSLREFFFLWFQIEAKAKEKVRVVDVDDGEEDGETTSHMFGLLRCEEEPLETGWEHTKKKKAGKSEKNRTKEPTKQTDIKTIKHLSLY